MNSFWKICRTATLVLALPAAAFAQQLEQWGTAGGWDVMIDPVPWQWMPDPGGLQ